MSFVTFITAMCQELPQCTPKGELEKAAACHVQENLMINNCTTQAYRLPEVCS